MNEELSSDMNPKPKPKMKITDLTIDCLEEILKFLDLENDLLNVAESNKRLNRAASLVFLQNNGKKSVVINPLTFDKQRIKLRNGWYHIYITDLRTGLKCVRCFGHVISELKIVSKIHYYDSNMSREGFIELVRYVNKYCAKSLVKLNVEGCCSLIFDRMHQSFEKVEEISVRNCLLDETKMNELFPQVQRLNLIGNRINLQCIAVNFPHLEHFEYLENIDNALPKNLANANFEEFIRINPQLKTFQLSINFHEPHIVSILSHVGEYLNRLEELDVSKVDYIFEHDVPVIHYERGKKLEIHWNSDELFPSTAFSFDQIKDFIAEGISYNDLMHFVKKNPTITHLKIKRLYLSEENIIEIAKALPSLTSLDISDMLDIMKYSVHSAGRNGFSVDKAIYLTAEFKQLKNFRFIANADYDVATLRTKLGGNSTEWDIGDLYYSGIVVTFDRSTE